MARVGRVPPSRSTPPPAGRHLGPNRRRRKLHLPPDDDRRARGAGEQERPSEAVLRINLLPFITAQLIVAVILFFSTPASADAPVVERPDDVVVASTTLTAERSDRFAMTATNIGAENRSFTLPAPAPADSITVHRGTWDGMSWQASLPAGATGTMSGRRS